MIYYLTKVAVTTFLVIVISEIAKRSSFAGALLASIPLVSVLAMIWLYVDTKDAAKVSALSTSVFWLALPSLVLFVTLPVLLKQGLNFYFSIGISISFTALLLLDYDFCARLLWNKVVNVWQVVWALRIYYWSHICY